MTLLESAAVASCGWAVLGLTLSAARAWRRGTARASAAPAGPAWPGVVYAFGAGMSPLAKESARLHPVAYAAGMAYHAGVFSALATFGLVIAHIEIPPSGAQVLIVLLFGGAAAGVGLAVHRRMSPLLTAISSIDDYAANLLVDAWLLAAAMSWLRPGATAAFLAVSILLGIYVPLGKIRHCVFFFLGRGLFGARLGRRGIIRSRLSGART